MSDPAARRNAILLAAGLFVAFVAAAQEAVPREEALKASVAAWLSTGPLDNAPFQVDADIKVPSVLKAGERGAMVVPETKLADMLKRASQAPSPLGLLWLRELSLVVDGKPVAASKVRVTTIKTGGADIALPLYLLGLRKPGPDRFELLVYGRDREPLAIIPIRKMSARQELPIEMTVVKMDDSTGSLTLSFLGEYQASITLAKSGSE